MRFRSLKSRIASIFLSLILLVQITGAVAIRLSIDENGRDAVSKQLDVGERIFQNLLNQNGESLTQAAKILATDYGFREAIGSNDYETILSALSNHQSRINADIAFFSASSSDRIAASGKVSEDEAKATIQLLIEHAQRSGDNRMFAVFKKQSYQLVAVPVKAPLTIGWIVMGFEINDKLANKLNKLSDLQVTFITRCSDNNCYATASTMGAAAAREIEQNFNAQIKIMKTDRDMRVLGELYETRFVKIYDNPQQGLYAILQRSISEATAPYQALQLNLLILTVIGALLFVAGIMYVSDKIAKPISDLANTAKQLEEGNYNVSLATERRDELGKLSNAFNSMIAAISLREKRILMLAFHDEMTDLPNRASFMMQLDQSIKTAEKNHEPLAVMVIDLNRFKQINNILGQASGDEILRRVADRLSANTRKSTDFVARFGGDEFAILLANTNEAASQHVAQTVLKSLETPLPVKDQLVDVTAAIGIVNYPEHGTSAEQLVSRSEIAMYVAKSRGLGSLLFENSFDSASQVNLSMATEIKQAIEKHEFIFFVQPKIDLKTRVVSSVEALIRWKHPTKGMVFPDQFIPFAEQAGLIHDITMWMLQEAGRISAEWKQAGIQVPIAVNLSARDLIDHDLPNKIAKILDQFALTAEAISLEITESSIMDDPIRAQTTLLSLNDMGLRQSIDDFGTGYSSLSYLKRLPVKELKIDKSFVMKMEEDANDRIIVQSTIALGHSLGLKVVAEGIENLELWAILEEMQCDYGQGYFMSRPINEKDFPTWLSKWTEMQTMILTAKDVLSESE